MAATSLVVCGPKRRTEMIATYLRADTSASESTDYHHLESRDGAVGGLLEDESARRIKWRSASRSKESLE